MVLLFSGTAHFTLGLQFTILLPVYNRQSAVCVYTDMWFNFWPLNMLIVTYFYKCCSSLFIHRYVAHTYNFFLYPHSFGPVDVRFLSQVIFVVFNENITVGRMWNFQNLSTKSKKRGMISVFIGFHEESSHTLMNDTVLSQNSCSINPYELSVCLWNLLLAMVSLWFFPFYFPFIWHGWAVLSSLSSRRIFSKSSI